MKLTEMNTEQLAKAICGIADPLSRIAQDKALNEAMTAYKKGYGEAQTVLQKSSGLLERVIPALLSAHYEDMVKVISVMTGKSVEEIAEQKGLQTIMDVKSFFDNEFALFFAASADTARGA